VRATLPPPALPVATAIVAAVLMPSAAPSAALAERWQRPVPGEVARPFSFDRSTPFAAGAHRGVVLDARAGTVVRAACGGRVVHAGPVAGFDLVLSVRCGARRVSYLPLAEVAVRAGDTVVPGSPLGTVAGGGLHLGVRVEGDRFGYVDPLPLLLGNRRGPFPPVGRPAGRDPAPLRRAPRHGTPRYDTPLRTGALEAAAARHTDPAGSPASAAALPPRTAPWTVWAGLALVLTGAAGSGTVVKRRRRLAQRTARAAELAA
jgi:hypothetical protein